MSEPKTYLPKSFAKEVDGRFGKFISIGLDVAELIKFANQHKDGKGKLRLNISPRREAGKYGETHSITLDTWRPTQGALSRAANQPNSRKSPIDDSDVPPRETEEIPF